MVVNNIASQTAPEASLNPTSSSATTLNTATKSTHGGATSPAAQEATETPGQEILEVGMTGETESAGNQSNQSGQSLNAFA